MSTPMRRIRSACFARAASGHAAATPPSSVMKSRRFNPSPRPHAAEWMFEPTPALRSPTSVVTRARMSPASCRLRRNRTGVRDARGWLATSRGKGLQPGSDFPGNSLEIPSKFPAAAAIAADYCHQRRCACHHGPMSANGPKAERLRMSKCCPLCRRKRAFRPARFNAYSP
jgi:hypothetical protein